MIDLFDELLSICLDRLADGDTVAACVADFPEVPDLGATLEIASALMSLQDERPAHPWTELANERPSGQAGSVRQAWADTGAA